MKVLEPGRKQSGWSAEAICTGKGNGDGGCGAKLLVEQPDLFLTHSSHRDETDTFVTFKCECCEVLTDIPDVPFNIRDTLPSYGEWKVMNGIA